MIAWPACLHTRSFHGPTSSLCVPALTGNFGTNYGTFCVDDGLSKEYFYSLLLELSTRNPPNPVFSVELIENRKEVNANASDSGSPEDGCAGDGHRLRKQLHQQY
jgi:hypothetical protein